MIISKKTDFAQATTLVRNMGRTMTRSELAARLRFHAGRLGAEHFRERAADELIRLTRPQDAVPEIYSEYRPVVRDGIRFLFTRLCLERLSLLIVDQLLMPEEAGVKERLIELAQQLPTLHKLGQIIARNRNLDPAFRKWLIRLENGAEGTAADEIRETVCRELGNYMAPFSVQIDDTILAEASVGAVAGFTWTAPDTGRRSRGVFKVLKPGVREKLREEFALLDGMARFFDQNRACYPLKEFRFIETFEDIKVALREEINLCGEQEHLRQAAQVYPKERSVNIPGLLPQFCTDNITAMKLVRGGKITDMPMSPEERRQCARALFDAVIWQPLFSLREETLFHGDPHAGNIYAKPDQRGRMRPVLLDWSLVGALSKSCRMNMVRLMCSIFLRDEALIYRDIAALAETAPDPGTTAQALRQIMAEPDYQERPFMERAFFLIDQTAVRGVRFPKDLLLFRKSFFTLEGVLHELDPDFSPDRYGARLFEKLAAEEFPRRWLYGILPRMDTPENYKSMISNRDLQMFCFHLLMAGVKRGTGMVSDLMEKNAVLGRHPGILSPGFATGRG